MWKKDVWEVEVLQTQRQFIYLKMTANNETPWFLMVLYRSPNPIMCREIWENLSSIAGSIQGLWCVGSDFNLVLSLEDSDSISNSSDDMKVFNDCLRTASLRDLGSNGQVFTWMRGNTIRRLDIIVVNIDWTSSFSHASVCHLPKFKSDHVPILLKIQQDSLLRQISRPFRILFHSFYMRTFLAL